MRLNQAISCFLPIILLCLPVNHYAQDVQSSVFLVKPILHRETSRSLIVFKDFIEKKMIPKICRSNRGCKLKLKKQTRVLSFQANNESWGSGFLVRESGSYYIITNRHVVEAAETVHIKTPDGHTTYKNQEILYVDNKYDIAVIQFKKGKKYDALTLSDGCESDTVVKSAGFPVVNMNPIYTFASGTITNCNARIAKGNYLQHTAKIDFGNSGGPLLRKNSSLVRFFSLCLIHKYEVIGINTLKVGTNNYYAIGSKYIKDVIKNAERRKSKSFIQKRLIIDGKHFARYIRRNVGDNDIESFMKMVSGKYLAINGLNDFKKIISIPGRQFAELQKKFIQGLFKDPIGTLRKASGFLMYIRLHNDRFSFSKVDELDAGKEDDVNTYFKHNGSTVSIRWILEHGQWRILHVPALSSSNEAQISSFRPMINLPYEEVEVIANACVLEHPLQNEKQQDEFVNCYIKIGYKTCLEKNQNHRDNAKKCLKESRVSLKGWIESLKVKLSHASDMQCKKISNKKIDFIATKCIQGASNSEKATYCIGDVIVKYCSKINTNNKSCVDVCVDNSRKGLQEWIEEKKRHQTSY